MNKLVSKNPILRFKLGKKIVKAEEGAVARWQRRIKHPIDSYNNLDRRIPNPFVWMDNQLARIGNSLIAENYTPENGGDTNNRLRRELQLLRTITALVPPNNNLKQQVTSRLTPEEKVIYDKVWKKLETDAKSKKGIYAVSSKTVTPRVITPRFLSLYSGRAKDIGGANNIKAWLLKLKDYYDAGTYSADSVWGDNTDKAYLKYLAAQNAAKAYLQAITTPDNDVITTAKEPVIIELNDFASLKAIGYPTSMETHARDLFDKVELRNPIKYIPNFTYTPNLSYYTPSFTYTPNNRFITFSKNGSKLVSKNPIKRFKEKINTNFR